MTNQTLYQLITELKPYGQHYDSKLEIKQITKNIRQALKPLVKEGFKFSVTSKWGTTTVSINLRVLVFPEDWIIFNPHYDQQASWEISVGKRNSWETGKDPREVFTELGKQFGKFLRSIANQWNYDKSDSYTDYYENNYFLTVSTKTGLMLA